MLSGNDLIVKSGVRIPLTQSQWAIVDEIDFETVSALKWYFKPPGHRTTGYAVHKDKKLMLYLHRFIWELAHRCKPSSEVDHKNGDGLDCRRENLRLASNSQNHANMKVRRGSRTGFKGVTFDSRRQKFKTQVTCKYKVYCVGRFDTPEEAARAYDRKAIELFGEHALTNHALGLLVTSLPAPDEGPPEGPAA